MEQDKKINFSHRSVLLDECIMGLDINPDGIYIDGTAGGGGHSYEIAKRLTGGKLIAIDQDQSAINAAGEKLSEFGDRVILVRNNFSKITEVCQSLGIEKINGVLLDLGVSSYQLDTEERGFSHNADAPLDMRMDTRKPLSAYEVVNTYSVDRLKKIFYDYGEEKFSPRIAQAIGRQREIEPIRTTGELVKIIKSAIPAAARDGGPHPAKRTFQAIRIEVNSELDVIAPAIEGALSRLVPGGRIAIISFHSLEDRIVKQTYVKHTKGCICPRGLPVCACDSKADVKIITKKPVLPSPLELEENPRSRSAKLRVAEKI